MKIFSQCRCGAKWVRIALLLNREGNSYRRRRRSLMNRFSKLSLLWLAGGMALAFMAPAVAAPTLTFKFAAINIPGSIDVNAYGVSESGVVVGEYLDTAGASHGFILKGKTVTEVNDSKGLATFCQGISPNGSTVVGYYIKIG